MAPTILTTPSSADTDEKSAHASSGSAAVHRCNAHAPCALGPYTRANVAAVCLGSSASDSTPAACHTPRSCAAASASAASDASSRRTAAGSAASHRTTRTPAPLAPSSAHSAAAPRASAPSSDASTSADAPRDSASQRAVSSPSPPVPPVTSITAFASRGTLKPPPDHSSSDSPGGVLPVVSIHGQPTGANPSLDAQPSGSEGSSARAVRAKPHEPAVATPTAERALLAANDADSSHTVGGAPCEPAIEDTSCRARIRAGSGKSESAVATTMTGRSLASSVFGALSRCCKAGSLVLPSSRMAPAPAELPPGASRHAVWYMCRRQPKRSSLVTSSDASDPSLSSPTTFSTVPSASINPFKGIPSTPSASDNWSRKSTICIEVRPSDSYLLLGSTVEPLTSVRIRQAVSTAGPPLPLAVNAILLGTDGSVSSLTNSKR
eukprot:scaffold4051_cov68-Phaeocystis_antarctica.AAC.7